MNIWIIVPAFNAEEAIEEVVRSLKDKYQNVVVVDDGSVDQTFAKAKNHGAVVLRHVLNRGQGAALRTGTEFAFDHGEDTIVHFDADGQMMVDDIAKIIQPVINGKVDISIGSRFLGRVINISRSKRLVLFFGRLYLWIFFGVRLSDNQCGFRALSRKAAGNIQITEDKMGHASEILIEVFKKNIKYVEVPVTIVYTDYSKEHTNHGRFHFLSGLKIALDLVVNRLLR